MAVEQRAADAGGNENGNENAARRSRTVSGFSWRRFVALTVAGLVGIAALLAAQVMQGSFAGLSLEAVAALVGQTLAVNGVLVAVAALLGTLLGDRVGLAVRSRDGATSYPVAAALGATAAVAILALDAWVFQPFVADAARVTVVPTTAASPALGLLVSVYGGVTEEILLRFGLMTALVWVAWKLRRTDDGLPTAGGVWAAVLLTTVAFGLGHLPATAAVFELTPAVLARAVVLNGVGGVVFGWLYWRRDLLAAMAAHYAASAVLLI